MVVGCCRWPNYCRVCSSQLHRLCGFVQKVQARSISIILGTNTYIVPIQLVWLVERLVLEECQHPISGAVQDPSNWKIDLESRSGWFEWSMIANSGKSPETIDGVGQQWASTLLQKRITNKYKTIALILIHCCQVGASPKVCPHKSVPPSSTQYPGCPTDFLQVHMVEVQQGLPCAGERTHARHGHTTSSITRHCISLNTNPNVQIESALIYIYI